MAKATQGKAEEGQRSQRSEGKPDEEEQPVEAIEGKDGEAAASIPVVLEELTCAPTSGTDDTQEIRVAVEICRKKGTDDTYLSETADIDHLKKDCTRPITNNGQTW